MELPDSGARREFDTGARRDSSANKGRCDLLPLDIVTELLEDSVLILIENFKKSKDVSYLFDAIYLSGESGHQELCTKILEVSKHYEDGALKYGENNWKKGMPLHIYIDSAVRHYLKYLRGDTDEPHDRAFIWNILNAIWTIKNRPELDDIVGN